MVILFCLAEGMAGAMCRGSDARPDMPVSSTDSDSDSSAAMMEE